MPSKHRECDVLRHARRLQRVVRPRDRHARGQVAGGEQLVHACAGAGDEVQVREAPRDARGQLEREDHFDVVGIRRVGVGDDRLVGRELSQRGELRFDERRGGEDQDRHRLGLVNRAAKRVVPRGSRTMNVLYRLTPSRARAMVRARSASPRMRCPDFPREPARDHRWPSAGPRRSSRTGGYPNRPIRSSCVSPGR